MQRLRELVDSRDPAMAELARLVRSVGELDPPRGAQGRVRAAITERLQSRSSWRKPLLVVACVVIALPTAIAGVTRLVPPWFSAPTPAVTPASGPPMRALPVAAADMLPLPDEPVALSARRYPSGDLAEEALALSIEAFAALDDRAALTLAEDYLRRFPQGRFRDQAEAARRRFQEHR